MDITTLITKYLLPLLSPVAAMLIFSYGVWYFKRNEKTKHAIHEEHTKMNKEQCVQRDITLLGAYYHLLVTAHVSGIPVTPTQFDYFKKLFQQCYESILDNPRIFKEYIFDTDDLDSDKYPPFVLLLLDISEKLRGATSTFIADHHVALCVHTLQYLFETEDKRIKAANDIRQKFFVADPNLKIFCIYRKDGK